jgi:hypothetical protein
MHIKDFTCSDFYPFDIVVQIRGEHLWTKS